MGMKDKFQDQAEQWQNQARQKGEQAREKLGNRGSQQPPQHQQPRERGRQEADDMEREMDERFDRDEDMI
ncbi:MULTISPECIES: hypothetical protein [unclassified Streptomyces]|jgi:hypothetical protein|uniref:hypothetical protein n=1 Tax=unclassified Streptomyces TaxID=2593676 RepID=UPI0034564C84